MESDVERNCSVIYTLYIPALLYSKGYQLISLALPLNEIYQYQCTTNIPVLHCNKNTEIGKTYVKFPAMLCINKYIWHIFYVFFSIFNYFFIF